jgi:hypothetical protein
MGCLERPLNLIFIVIMTLGLGGCVPLSADGGMAPVQGIAFAELKADAVKVSTEPERAAAAERVATLLKRPLTLGTAVQIALLNNRGLQAAYNDSASRRRNTCRRACPLPAVRLQPVGRRL